MPKDTQKRLSAAAAFRALRKLRSRPLAEKIDRARQIIADTLETGPAAVAFSGGKDSVTLAHLARQLAPTIPLVWINTGLAEAQLVEFVRGFAGADLVELKPETHPEQWWKETGRLPIGPKVSAAYYRKDNPELQIHPTACCERHKAKPMAAYLKTSATAALLNGARGDESNRHRFKLATGEVFRAAAGHILAYPLLTWTHTDSLAYVRQNVPNYPLVYGQHEELGCRACAADLTRYPNQLAALRSTDPEYHRRVIVDFGFGLEILMIKYGLTRAGAQAQAERETWPALIEAGAFDRIPYPRKGHR